MRAEENRVLVVAPVGQDAVAMASMLRGKGVAAEPCSGPEECLKSLAIGAGALLLTEEALELPGAAELLESFRRQPAWSELPLIILTSGGESRFAKLLEIAAEVAGGMTLLERPMRVSTLLHSVQVALRSRQRQYQVRDLLAERERFRALVTATSDAVYRMSADWKEMLELHGKGFIPDTETASGTWLSKYIPTEDQIRILETIRGAIESRSVFALEHRVIRADGTMGWAFSRAIPLLDVDGEIVEWFGTATDITERKRSEEALRESERLLREFLEQLPVGAALMGPQGEVKVSNGTYRRLVPERIPSQDTERQKRWRTWDAQGKPVEPINWPGARALRGERVMPGMEFLFTEADGREVWLRVTAVPFRSASGDVLGAISIIEDIDAVKQAAERLRESEERLRMAKSAARLGLYDYDIVSGRIQWDERIRELWGIAPEMAVTYEVFMAGVYPEDRAGTQAAVERALAVGGDGNYEAEYRVLSAADGRKRWVSAIGKVTFENGRAVRLLGMAQDITERREFQAELERVVAQRTAELREMVEELEHFSYSITHDMRAPLRAMMGFTDLAKQLCSGCAHQDQKIYWDRIQMAAKRMDLLITDALNYSKAVRIELSLEPVDLGRLLREMVDTYPELRAAQEGIRIETEMPIVMGNEAALTQCFSNLLGNAVKFVDPGKQPEIRVWAEAGGKGEAHGSKLAAGWVRIWVEDRGIGIGAKMLPRVFDMFARGASPQSGTGIGLALVRKVVQRMGGRVGVDSEEGVGSRFWFELRSAESNPRASG